MELCNQKAFTSKGALAVEECLEVIVIYTSSYDDWEYVLLLVIWSLYLPVWVTKNRVKCLCKIYTFMGDLNDNAFVELSIETKQFIK